MIDFKTDTAELNSKLPKHPYINSELHPQVIYIVFKKNNNSIIKVELEFSRCVKHVPAEFHVDPYIEGKGQMEVRDM